MNHLFENKPVGSNAYRYGCRCDRCRLIVRTSDRVRKRAAIMFREMHPDLWEQLYAEERTR